MKVRFNTYVYFDKNSDDKNEYDGNSEEFSQYKFNQEQYQQYVDKQQYEQAADYLDKFVFYGEDDSAEMNKEFKTNIATLRRQGRKVASIYNNIEDERDNAAVSFYDAFRSGSLSALDKEKPYVREMIDNYEEAKRNIGGTESDKLTVTFKPGKRSLFNSNNTLADFLVRDNSFTIEDFYERSGLKLEDLKRYGINVMKDKDGSTSFTFDKSSKLADRILYNIATPETASTMDWLLAQPYDYPVIKGNKEKPKSQFVNTMERKMSVITDSGYNYVKTFQEYINECKEIKNKYTEIAEDATKEYEAISIKYTTDAIEAVKSEYRNNPNMKESEYNAKLRNADDLYTTIKTLGYEHYDIYSNYYNALQENGITSLQKINLQDYATVTKLLSETPEKDMEFTGKIVNGKTGICVTINRRKQDDLKNGDPLEDKLYSQRIEFWIPGLKQSDIQRQIDSDTKTRASIEYNDMLDYRYDYTLNDGSTISINDSGEFVKHSKNNTEPDRVLNREKVIQEINRDIILRDASNELLFKCMNYKGNLVNESLYNDMAKSVAIHTAKELYPNSVSEVGENTGILNINGITNISLEDILTHNYNDEHVSYEVKNVLDEIYNMYNNLLTELVNYK